MEEAKSVETIVQDHERRILKLENSYEELHKAQQDTKDTIAKEFSTTKDMLVYQQKQNELLLTQSHSIKQQKLTNKKDIILGIIGGGGILGGIGTTLTVIIVNWDKIIKIFGG